VIASYAEFYKADILSADKDIASKFPGATYKVYKNYHYTTSKETPLLVLEEHYLTNSSEQTSYDSRKLILDPLPTVNDDHLIPELLLRNPKLI